MGAVSITLIDGAIRAIYIAGAWFGSVASRGALIGRARRALVFRGAGVRLCGDDQAIIPNPGDDCKYFLYLHYYLLFLYAFTPRARFPSGANGSDHALAALALTRIAGCARTGVACGAP